MRCVSIPLICTLFDLFSNEREREKSSIEQKDNEYSIDCFFPSLPRSLDISCYSITSTNISSSSFPSNSISLSLFFSFFLSLSLSVSHTHTHACIHSFCSYVSLTLHSQVPIYSIERKSSRLVVIHIFCYTIDVLVLLVVVMMMIDDDVSIWTTNPS